MGIAAVQRSIIASLFPLSDNISTENTILASALLTFLLIVFAPLLSIYASIPPILIVLITGIVYLFAIIHIGGVVEGVLCAPFALVTFNANFPILSHAGRSLNLYLVDLVLIPLLFIFLFIERPQTVPSLSKESLPGYALSVVVLMSFISAAVGNGPSQLLALFFAVMQIRYLLLFLLAVIVVRRAGFMVVVYPFLITTAGHIAYASAEAFAGHSFGLTYLGDLSRQYGHIPPRVVGPIQIQVGLFPGGLVGSSRILAAMILLSLPFLFWFFSQYHGVRRYIIGLTIVIMTVYMIIPASSAVLGAFILTLLMIVIVFTAYYGRQDIEYSKSIGFAVLLIPVEYLLFKYLPRGMARQNGGGKNGSQTFPRLSGDGNIRSLTTDKIFEGSGKIIESSFHMIKSFPIISDNLTTRLFQYVIALDIALQYPLFGIGGWNFRLVANSYGLLHSYDLHNTYLAYLAGIGVIGFAAFLISIIAILWVIIELAVSIEHQSRLLFGLLLCGFLGFHALAFWVVLYVTPVAYGVFWALCGAIIGYRHAVTSSAELDPSL